MILLIKGEVKLSLPMFCFAVKIPTIFVKFKFMVAQIVGNKPENDALWKHT